MSNPHNKNSKSSEIVYFLHFIFLDRLTSLNVKSDQVVQYLSLSPPFVEPNRAKYSPDRRERKIINLSLLEGLKRVTIK